MEFNALAQEAGYEYNLADNGWRDWAKTERGAFKKVKELVNDAEKRSVGIWLWQSAMDKVWFTPYRRRFFKKCEKLGIKGIKLDHIESETQFMAEFTAAFRARRQSTSSWSYTTTRRSRRGCAVHSRM